MRPTREAYVRAWTQLDGLEVHVGVEFRDGDDLHEMSDLCMDFMGLAFEGNSEDEDVVREVETMLQHEWPDRAYFLETERAGRGLQIYQPWGPPRNPPTTDSQEN